MSLARIRTVASFTYPGPNPAFVSVDEMSGDNFTVHVRDHANRMGVSGRQVSFTMDGDSFRAFIEQARAALSEDKGE
jgi:hypothetical protein